MVSQTQAVFLGFMGLLVAERLVELWLSKRNAARAFARGGVETGQAHYRVMVVFHTLFLVACVAEVFVLRRPFPGAWGWVALGGAVLAQALRYWAIATLGERWNSRIIVVPGLSPVTGGPYRFLRHPNYVAVVLELLVVPLIHGAWLTAAVFTVGNAALLFVRISAEEQALGEVYAQSFEGRPRFIPEVRRG
jgi:methyltransferase